MVETDEVEGNIGLGLCIGDPSEPRRFRALDMP